MLRTVLEVAMELRASGSMPGGAHGGAAREEAGEDGEDGPKQTLLFVVRDKTGGTPSGVLARQIREQLEGVWREVWQQQPADEERPSKRWELSDHFEIKSMKVT